jgi:hypothetical protein
MLHTATGDHERAIHHGRESMAVGRRIGERRVVAVGAMALGWAVAGAGDLVAGRRLLAEAVEMAVEIHQMWTAAMSRLLLARTLLRASNVAGGAVADPAAAIRALRLAVRGFTEEDDVGNVLSSLLAGAHALLLLGREADGAAMAAGVRREVARRGLNFEPADPVGTAALNAALAATGPAGETGAASSTAAMIALLGAAAG